MTHIPETGPENQGWMQRPAYCPYSDTSAADNAARKEAAGCRFMIASGSYWCLLSTRSSFIVAQLRIGKEMYHACW